MYKNIFKYVSVLLEGLNIKIKWNSVGYTFIHANCPYVQWTRFIRVVHNRINRLVNTYIGRTESFYVLTVLKCTALVNQSLNIITFSGPK